MRDYYINAYGQINMTFGIFHSALMHYCKYLQLVQEKYLTAICFGTQHF